MLETVESTLGVPDPVELAKQDRMARDAKEPDETPNGRSECSNGKIEDFADFFKIHDCQFCYYNNTLSNRKIHVSTTYSKNMKQLLLKF